MPTLQDKLKTIEQAAYDLGFDGFGVTRPELGEAASQYQEWLERGYHGEMGYMERTREKRADPEKVLPGVKSVICLRTDYLTQEKDLRYLRDGATGDISLYALNEDYHDVLTRRHRGLEEKLRETFPGCRAKSYIDTGPVLEKALAQKAGLGWIGKHTNLLTEHLGSWYFLSEILVDVELPASPEAADRCGTCRECIDICPTGAIVAPYVLDSRKCISYLTIELKGPIPEEYRKALGNRIYGCDDCQLVCPWNSYARMADEPAFQERRGTRKLIELLRMDDEAFRERFRKSPVKRIKRRGLLRNVAVALGNSADPEAIPPLIEALADREPLIRAHVVWALGELLGRAALPVVEENLRAETETMVQEEMRRLRQRFEAGFQDPSSSSAGPEKPVD